MRSLLRRLQLFSSVFDRSDITTLCIDGKDEGIGRASINNDVVPTLRGAKSGQGRGRERGRSQQCALEQHGKRRRFRNDLSTEWPVEVKGIAQTCKKNVGLIPLPICSPLEPTARTSYIVQYQSVANAPKYSSRPPGSSTSQKASTPLIQEKPHLRSFDTPIHRTMRPEGRVVY